MNVQREPIDHGTEETRAKLRQDPVSEMAEIWRRRSFRDAAELEDAAREIRRIYNATVSGLMCRAVDWKGVRGAATPAPEWLVIAKRDRYDKVANEQGPTGNWAVLIDWLIDEIPLRQIDRERNRRNGWSSDVVVHCLTRYAQIAGWIR